MSTYYKLFPETIVMPGDVFGPLYIKKSAYFHPAKPPAMVPSLICGDPVGKMAIWRSIDAVKATLTVKFSKDKTEPGDFITTKRLGMLDLGYLAHHSKSYGSTREHLIKYGWAKFGPTWPSWSANETIEKLRKAAPSLLGKDLIVFSLTPVEELVETKPDQPKLYYRVLLPTEETMEGDFVLADKSTVDLTNLGSYVHDSCVILPHRYCKVTGWQGMKVDYVLNCSGGKTVVRTASFEAPGYLPYEGPGKMKFPNRFKSPPTFSEALPLP